MKIYRGSGYVNLYVAVANRGTQALAINVAKDLAGSGLVVRFVIMSEDGEYGSLSYLKFREWATLKSFDGMEKALAARLNKFQIKLPGAPKNTADLVEFMHMQNNFQKLAAWIQQIAESEGFSLLGDTALPVVIRNLIAKTYSAKQPAGMPMPMELPGVESHDVQALPKISTKKFKAEVEEVDSEEEDSEDEEGSDEY